MSQLAQTARSLTWRTPTVIIVCGCLIALLGFGPRSSFGFFLTPMSQANGWGRDVFALAFALQNLLWGIGQPFAGAIADRFGMVRVLCVGALLYAAGLALMAYTTSPVTNATACWRSAPARRRARSDSFCLRRSAWR
jgi:MFS family permease